MSRLDYDNQIPARDLKVGDEIHLTVMGGDEYFTVTKTEREGETVRWEATGVADVGDSVPQERLVWIRKTEETNSPETTH